jgi:hypothetical protein
MQQPLRLDDHAMVLQRNGPTAAVFGGIANDTTVCSSQELPGRPHCRFQVTERPDPACLSVAAQYCRSLRDDPLTASEQNRVQGTFVAQKLSDRRRCKHKPVHHEGVGTTDIELVDVPPAVLVSHRTGEQQDTARLTPELRLGNVSGVPAGRVPLLGELDLDRGRIRVCL